MQIAFTPQTLLVLHDQTPHRAIELVARSGREFCGQECLRLVDLRLMPQRCLIRRTRWSPRLLITLLDIATLLEWWLLMPEWSLLIVVLLLILERGRGSLLLMLIPVRWGLTLAVVVSVVVVVTTVGLEMMIRLEGLFHHVHDGGVNVRLRSLC